MKKEIPFLLILLRLLLGILILLATVLHFQHLIFITVSFIVVGYLSDVLDGMIARRLKVSTQKLRRLDSTIDQIFFICIIIALYLQSPEFFHLHSTLLFILIGSDILTYIVCYLRFHKEVATHSFGAKIWSVILVCTLVQIAIAQDSIILFQICFWLGILSRLEIIAILFILKEWTTDVPTLVHSIRLRAGKPIRRNKYFHG